MENHSSWSGDATRNRSYDFGNTQGITINFGSDDAAKKEQQEKKEQPIWMVESTIKAEPKDVSTDKFYIFAFDQFASRCTLENNINSHVRCLSNSILKYIYDAFYVNKLHNYK